MDDLQMELERVDAREPLVAPVARDASTQVGGLDVSRQVARRRAPLLANGARQPPQPALASTVFVGPRGRLLFDGDRDRRHSTAPGAAVEDSGRIQAEFGLMDDCGMLNDAMRTRHPTVAFVRTIARR